jgi:hypothetical protein
MEKKRNPKRKICLTLTILTAYLVGPRRARAGEPLNVFHQSNRLPRVGKSGEGDVSPYTIGAPV